MIQLTDTTISPRQRAIFNFIRSFIEQNNYPPSIRDIVNGCGISSTSVAAYHLKQLESRGYLRRRPEISRGLEIASMERPEEVRIPLIGRIAAGSPIPVPEADTWASVEVSESVKVPASLVEGHRDVFALKVKGDSMQDALIGDGDTVLLQQVPEVANGQTAAVWLKDQKEVTLKKVYVSGDRVRLEPANKSYSPIVTSARNIDIQGKVIAVFRSL